MPRMRRNSARTKRAMPVQPVTPMNDHNHEELAAKEGDERDEEKQERNGLDDFQDAHAEDIDGAREVAHHGAVDDADEQGDDFADEANLQHHAGAPQEPGDGIAAIAVGSEPVVLGGIREDAVGLQGS